MAIRNASAVDYHAPRPTLRRTSLSDFFEDFHGGYPALSAAHAPAFATSRHLSLAGDDGDLDRPSRDGPGSLGRHDPAVLVAYRQLPADRRRSTHSRVLPPRRSARWSCSALSGRFPITCSTVFVTWPGTWATALPCRQRPEPASSSSSRPSVLAVGRLCARLSRATVATTNEPRNAAAQSSRHGFVPFGRQPFLASARHSGRPDPALDLVRRLTCSALSARTKQRRSRSCRSR